MASQKLLAPNTKIIVVDAGGFADPSLPTAAELNAGTDLSDAIVTGYKLNPTDSDKDPTKAITNNANTATLTFSHYEGELTFFRGSLSAPVTAYTNAYNKFKTADVDCYIVRRVGKLNTVTFAINDVVDIFRFISDNPSTVEPDNGGPIQLKVPFLEQNEMYLGVTIAA